MTIHIHLKNHPKKKKTKSKERETTTLANKKVFTLTTKLRIIQIETDKTNKQNEIVPKYCTNSSLTCGQQ